ncbi:MAG: peptide deformylase [Oligoflexales bacterium]
MSILKVVKWPEQVLETKAEEVLVFDEDFQGFVKDMQETMKAAHGIGLAANQVGVLKRVLTIEIPAPEDDEEEAEETAWWHDKEFVFVNPVIISRKGKIQYTEGCLSFPEVYENIERYAEIVVTAKNALGESFEVTADGLFSICLQHEIDHLDGIVFTQRMSRLKASMVKKRLLKRARFEEKS